MPSNRISRRSLISAAAILPAQAVRGTAANSAITVGLIGCGGRGTFDATLVANKVSGARLVALADLFPERIEAVKKAAKAPDASAYASGDELLAKSGVDAVIVATPVYLHPDHFAAAVRAKKHLYIEKPAGADVAGVHRLIAAADSAAPSLNIAFGLQQRYSPCYRKAKQQVEAGAIGRLVAAHSYWVKSGVSRNHPFTAYPKTELEKVRHWHEWRDLFGDYIVENNVHGIDVLNWFCGGHPTQAIGTGGSTLIEYGDNFDHSYVVFDYPNNVRGLLNGTMIAPHFYRDVREQFFGAKGAIETHREYWRHFRGENDVLTEKAPREITIDALQEFIDRIRDNRPENAARSAAESTLTAIMGRMAVEERRQVSWDEMLNPALQPNTLSEEEKRDGYTLLFNGHDLTGWDGDPQLWSVRDGVIVGSSDGHSLQHNTFLIYRDQYANFVLHADMRLRNHNSGIQFRSTRQPDWVVTGFQADASEAGPENSAWGNFYEEKGRSRSLMRSPDEGWLKAKSVVRHGDWNHYEIVADGHHLVLRLNGVTTIDQQMDKTDAGVIAIQLHMFQPMQVELRNLKLKKLS